MGKNTASVAKQKNNVTDAPDGKNYIVKQATQNIDLLNDPKWKINAPVGAVTTGASSMLNQGKLTIELDINNNVNSMRFNWKENVPVAVFTRAGYLWVVFDQKVSLDFSKLRSDKLEIISQPQQIETNKGTAFRTKLVDGISVAVWRDGNTWVVDLAPQQARPDVAFSVRDLAD